MVKKIICLMFFVLWFSAGQALADGVTTIRVNEQAAVEGPFITLGDIAVISGDNERYIQTLREVKLGSAALPGGEVTLTKELLRMRLSGSGVGFSGVEWEIPETITISTQAQTVSGKALLEAAMLVLTERLGSQGNAENAVIKAVSAPQDILIPVGELALTAEIPYGVHYNTPMAVNVLVSIGGKKFTVLGLKFMIKDYREVVVVAKPIARREILGADSLCYERMDTGRLPRGYLTDINKALGMTARRALISGVVLDASMLDKPILIKRGSIVNIIARAGGIEVTVAAKALQDGIQDQIIKVQNLSSQKVVSARVLDEQSVLAFTYSK